MTTVCIIPSRTSVKLPGFQRQGGAVLLTALLLLVMLALLGVNVAQTGSLEERMAGNARKRELAFEQAEAALAYVQNNLTTNANITAIPAPTGLTGNTCGSVCKTGMYQINLCNPNTANYWNGTGDLDCNGTKQSFAWSDTTAALPLSVTAGPPWYIVERLPDTTVSSGTQKNYRVTVYGTGDSNTNQSVILQALFTK
ncbi:PilX N-terminal domain-containing pilus assembly protein [Methylomonas sp. AM2-LC]|uniref:pilus assembly PilX family protein n=1 Tax=Methylomonas sp. AM2-LC TaxID=3153301 RepID=UPI003262F23B